MEELALKPLEPVPTNVNYSALEQNSIVRSVITYNYGEDISKWAVIKPFTRQHLGANSILTLFDADSTSYYQLTDAGAGTQTTTIELDFGKVLEARGLIFSFSLETNGVGAGTALVSSYYSNDHGVTWNLIATTSQTALLTHTFYDHIANFSRISNIKLVVETWTSGAANYATARLYQLMTIV